MFHIICRIYTELFIDITFFKYLRYSGSGLKYRLYCPVHKLIMNFIQTQRERKLILLNNGVFGDSLYLNTFQNECVYSRFFKRKSGHCIRTNRVRVSHQNYLLSSSQS
jgi:hypothetical protein